MDLWRERCGIAHLGSLTLVPSHPLDDGVLAVRDFEPLAQAVTEPAMWDYLTNGAGDQRSLSENIAAWQRPEFVPRVLVPADDADTAVSIFNRRWPHPIALAPTAFQSSYHPEGEAGSLRGALASGATYIQSTMSSVPLNELGVIAREGNEDGRGHWWFQTYLNPDRGVTRALVESAVAAGAEAVVLTVDSPVLAARDADRRNNRHLMPDDGVQAHQRILNPVIDPLASWEDIDWLREVSGVPVVVKGVLHPDDAVRAVDHGAAAVVVSNHGARNLDTVVPTAQVLPHVVHAVAGRAHVLVDGGIRRGTDIVRALALGADAVLIGRPYVWALASHGAAGVQHCVEILRTELSMAMLLLGAPSRAELTAELFGLHL
ncbi:MAG TPA: alpha-hydroxy-acid oxidizing enzyme [Actinobacteria bacterium]|nr:alpha-hydroxy-acid oxidizing enzyme [Actinomycetota bacterium]HCK78648.1 alpha-hydroxy-acid oxidizing enzyme [Actinomycetota bacterium]